MNCFLDTVFKHAYMTITVIKKRENLEEQTVRKKSKPLLSCRMLILAFKITSAGPGGVLRGEEQVHLYSCAQDPHTDTYVHRMPKIYFSKDCLKHIHL